LRIIGHRGAAARCPENTLASLRYALECGVDGVEFDVRATGDGHLVLMHDASVDRTTNGSGLLRHMTLNEVKRLSAGGEPIPTLDEALETLKDRVKEVFVEIKEPDIAIKVLEKVETAGMLKQAVFTSFYHWCLREIKDLEPRAETCPIVPCEPVSVYCIARSCGACRISINKKYVTRRLVEQAHAFGIIVHVWTVNDPDEMRRLADLGVDSLVTDAPDTAVRILKQ